MKLVNLLFTHLARRRPYLVLCWCLLCICIVPALLAAKQEETPAALTVRLMEHISVLEGYRVHMKLMVYSPEPEEQNQMLWYRRGGFVRIEQLGPYRTGAVVVVRPDLENLVEARAGGVASIMKFSFSPDNSLVRGITGDRPTIADYQSILAAFQEIIGQGLVTRFRLQEGDYQGSAAWRAYVEINREKARVAFLGKEDAYEMVVLQKELRLVRLNRFLQGKLISSVEWSRFEANPSLQPGFFRL